ncbi:MAG: HAMP domain-containing histidine kinase, partial [Bacteriovoracaceae bacterium]|nr:HAMP domain-containing histidine kinase [Bacteriovoracaceae bacterium]
VLLSKVRPPEEMEKFHHSLAQELDRMSQLVRDMLLVSRVEAGRAHFNFTPVRLDEIVTENVARLGLKAKQKQIALKFDLDTELIEHDQFLEISGERQLLGCQVENLIENAIKYSPSHSIISVNLKLTANGVSFEIKDQGPGIPQDVRERLKSSERFFRGEHTASISGSGLGLYLVRKIADYHSTKLEILDTPQTGAHFRLIFSQNPRA